MAAWQDGIRAIGGPHLLVTNQFRGLPGFKTRTSFNNRRLTPGEERAEPVIFFPFIILIYYFLSESLDG